MKPALTQTFMAGWLLVQCLALLGSAFSLPAHAQTPAVPQAAQDSLQPPPVPHLTPAQLQADVEIMKHALRSLHPGLYRYNDSTSLALAVEALEATVQNDLTLPEAYLAFSKFLAKIKCGHTYANFWNQPEPVQHAVFNQADKVPFTFRLIGKRMFITQNASAQSLAPGTEILSLNGTSVSTILDTLITVVKADGSNDGKRLSDLQLSGVGDYEAFDVYYPLFFPVPDHTFNIAVRDPTTQAISTITVSALTRSGRAVILEQRYGLQPTTNDDLWQFRILDDRTAHLKLGTFVTWRMEMDWKQFLNDAFAEMDRLHIENLILDLRGNEGGDTTVNDLLFSYLVTRPIQLTGRQARLRYSKIPPALAPYLFTWDDSLQRPRRQGRAPRRWLVHLEKCHTRRPNHQPNPASLSGPSLRVGRCREQFSHLHLGGDPQTTRTGNTCRTRDRRQPTRYQWRPIFLSALAELVARSRPPPGGVLPPHRTTRPRPLARRLCRTPCRGPLARPGCRARNGKKLNRAWCKAARTQSRRPHWDLAGRLAP